MRGTSFALSLALLIFFGVRDGHAQEWKEFRSADLRFRIVMPADPEVTNENFKLEDGSTSKGTSVASTANNIRYSVSFWEPKRERVGTSPEAYLESLRDASVAGKTLVGDKKVTVSGAPGREFAVAGGGFTQVIRNVFDRDRVYLLMVTTRTSTQDAPSTRKFLDSFAITAKCIVGC
jgi:hypothetical protein